MHYNGLFLSVFQFILHVIVCCPANHSTKIQELQSI